MKRLGSGSADSPVGLRAELAQADAARLAAAHRAPFAAEVAAQRAAGHQSFQEDLVQRQVVGAQPARSGRREVHLGVAVRTQHRHTVRGGVRAGHREGLEAGDAVGAEGVQTGEDPGVPEQTPTRGADRSGVRRGSSLLRSGTRSWFRLGSVLLTLQHSPAVCLLFVRKIFRTKLAWTLFWWNNLTRVKDKKSQISHFHSSDYTFQSGLRSRDVGHLTPRIPMGGPHPQRAPGGLFGPVEIL